MLRQRLSPWHAGLWALASIHEIIGSDIDAQAVQFAARNLALLTPAGLDKRVQELATKYHDYGKESHQAALQSAEMLREQVTNLAGQHPIRTRVFQASAFNANALMAHLGETRVDIVLTDIPYGRHSEWRVDNLAQAQNQRAQCSRPCEASCTQGVSWPLHQTSIRRSPKMAMNAWSVSKSASAISYF